MTRTHEPATSGSTTDLGGQARWIDLDGPVHYLDFGGLASGPVIVCVHGLAGPAVNWSAIAPLLTGRCRLIAPDIAGHGLTPSAGRGISVASNRVLLHRFIESVPDGPVILLGHSMGGMISLLEAGSAPHAVADLVLVSRFRRYSSCAPRQRSGARSWVASITSPEAAVAAVLSLCSIDVSRMPEDVLAQHVQVARRRAAFTGTAWDMSAAMRSVIATADLGSGRAYRRVIRSVTCPVLLVHGEQDRLIPVTAAYAAARANPSWAVTVLAGVGHLPQLEAPRECAAAITEWLGSAGQPAAESAKAARPGPPDQARAVRRRHGSPGHPRFVCQALG